MTSLQIEVARTAIDEMFRGGHFSICVIDNILKLTGGVPRGQDYDTLRLLHCVDFKRMPPNVRIELPRLIQRVIESSPITCEIFQVISIDGSSQRRIA